MVEPISLPKENRAEGIFVQRRGGSGRHCAEAQRQIAGWFGRRFAGAATT